MRRSPRHTLLAAVLLAVATAACAPAISALDVEGARAEARVKTALVNDPVVGPRVITVRVVGGVAQLSGRVQDEAEAARAAAVARGVAGITAVDLRLQVGDVVPDVVADDAHTDPTRDASYELAELQDRPGLVAVGAAVGWANQRGRGEGARASLQPLVKLGSASGPGVTLAFEWYQQSVALSPDATFDAGVMTVRPLMAGVHYTLPIGRMSLSPSVVAGYAFNRLSVPQEGAARDLPVDVTNSLVWRPGLALWVDATRRTAFTVSVGRAFTRPRVTYVENGLLVDRHVRAGATVLLAGVVYRLF
ncbi:MAG: BON domain-containing protein [Vicinamibacterales bacterium]